MATGGRIDRDASKRSFRGRRNYSTLYYLYQLLIQFLSNSRNKHWRRSARLFRSLRVEKDLQEDLLRTLGPRSAVTESAEMQQQVDIKLQMHVQMSSQ